MTAPQTEMAEPQLDIQELFRHYNTLYFDNALGACTVVWSPRMRRNYGTCHFIKAGQCKICLSGTLLKPRSSVDIKNYLLHEMVHAFLWIKGKTKNHSEHGPNFWTITNEINSNVKDDHQRPFDGYRITDKHEFHDEVDTYQIHQQMCESCGYSIKGGISSGQSTDSLQKTGNGGECGKFSCQLHRHMKLFPDQYNKADISSLKGKGKRSKGNDRDDHIASYSVTKRTRRTQPLEKEQDEDDLKRQGKSTKMCSSVTDTTKYVENKSFQTDRTPKYQTYFRKKFNLRSNEGRKVYKPEREISLVIPWLGVCADEVSEEDAEPLANSRSERRVKLLEEIEGRSEQVGSTPQEAIFLD